MSDARQKRGKLRYTIAYVIWANKKTESFEYHWFRALAMFDVTSFLAILSCIGRHFKFCQYVNCCPTINIVCTSRPVVKCWPHIWMVLGSILDGCIHKGTNAVCVWPKTKLNRAGEWMWPTRSNQSNNGQFPNCQSWFRVKIVWSLCDLVNTKENILPVHDKPFHRNKRTVQKRGDQSFVELLIGLCAQLYNEHYALPPISKYS